MERQFDVPVRGLMRYFLDTEFVARDKHLDLISIGVVKEDVDSEMLYQCNRDVDLNKADDWIIFNVFPTIPVANAGDGRWIWTENLKGAHGAREFGYPSRAVVVSSYDIKDRLRRFVGDDPAPEFWGYYSAFDWTLVCQIFGRLIDLPKNWPQHCNDLKQALMMCGNPKPPAIRRVMNHHALEDALWVRTQYLWLKSKYPEQFKIAVEV